MEAAWNSDADPRYPDRDRVTYDNFYGLSVFLEKLFKKRVEILTPDGVDSIRVEEVARSIRESVGVCLSAASCRR